MCHPRPLHGFTLVELLVVVSIIALLIALLLPALGKARDAARMTRCMSQMHQQAVALAGYAVENNGYLPAPYKPDTTPATLYQKCSWAYAIWDYTQSGVFAFTGNDLQGNEGLDRNIFHCPVTKTMQLATPTPPLVSAVNTNVMSYAMNMTPSAIQNSNIAGQQFPYRLERITHPASAVNILESSFGWVDANAFNLSWGAGLIPHGGGANGAFYDGHLEHRSLNDIPLYDGVYVNYYDPKLDVFWSGQ
ncbi:MAG: type II secretion system protein [Phycisphaerales bacterium]